MLLSIVLHAELVSDAQYKATDANFGNANGVTLAASG